jgi:16S rRNA (cytosine1402-N4)-methyltransferase
VTAIEKSRNTVYGPNMAGQLDPGDPNAAPRRRRQRYRGTHPRRFTERYKELDPARYPEQIEHVRAQGRTPAGSHVPIMVDAILSALQPRPGDVVVDCTLGYGGHAAEMLRRIAPSGILLGLDIDGEHLERARSRLEALAATLEPPPPVVHAFHRNFAGLSGALSMASGRDGAPLGACDAILADLGVSSMQIDDPSRGLSYKYDGPLDMRMDLRIARTAADWLRVLSARELSAYLVDLADEPDADAIASEIVAARGRRAFTRTGELATLVCGVKRTRDKSAAALTFQALRMLVNDERGALQNLLRIAPGCLRLGGRIAIVSFHSGEDRLVKQAFQAGLAAGMYEEIARDPVRADATERRANPRSAAAKLRWARRTSAERAATMNACPTVP